MFTLSIKIGSTYGAIEIELDEIGLKAVESKTTEKYEVYICVKYEKGL